MNVTGTKLACRECRAQAVVIKAGDGEVRCHGAPMEIIAGAPGGISRPSGVREPGGDREE